VQRGDSSPDDWLPVPDDSGQAPPLAAGSFPGECSAELPDGTRLPEDDSPADWVLVPRPAYDLFPACYLADSLPDDYSGPDSPLAYSDGRSVDFPDAIGFPEFPEQLLVAERSPEDARWSLSLVFLEALPSLRDVPQPRQDASLQPHVLARAPRDGLPSPVAFARTELALEVEFSSQLPAGSPPLRVGLRRDRLWKPSPPARLGESEQLRLCR
jgi:hypothetical protein